MRVNEARKALLLADSYSRMEVLIALRSELRGDAWLRLVGEFWSMCDNIGAHRLVMRRLLPQHGPVPQLMTAAERSAWDKLPPLVTLYRGCGPRNMLGASWSTERSVAARFPTLHRYWQEEPMLVEARTSKRHCLGVKLDRGESEVITFRARRISVERLRGS